VRRRYGCPQAAQCGRKHDQITQPPGAQHRDARCRADTGQEACR
jgi:hypothetical protein